LDGCPDKTYEDDENCKPCEKNCTACENGKVCNTCDDGFFLIDNDCVEECPEKTYKNLALKICAPCEESCKTCETADECKTCDKKEVLTASKKCSGGCGKKYYNNNGTCKPCKK
jgi:proprotein convertase subtilisin/kexin type 5